MPGLPDRPARPAGQCWPVAPVVLDLLIYLGLTRIVRRHNTAVTYLSLVACAAITFLVSAQPIIEGHIERSGKPIDVIPDSNHPPLSKEKLAHAHSSFCRPTFMQLFVYSVDSSGQSITNLKADFPPSNDEYLPNCALGAIQ